MIEILARLGALAHDARLGIFRLLVRSGRAGLAAGEIGARLDIPPTALSFHLNRLRQAGLVRQRRQGQRLIYAAEYAAMRELIAYLSDQCCAESETACDSDCPPPPDEAAPAAQGGSHVLEAEES